MIAPPRWRSIGVIGGMGPAATADFVSRLVAAVDTGGASGLVTAADAAHPHLYVDCNPNVPDRSAAFAGEGESPGPVLAAMARGLVTQGAEVLAMPCNAAHIWAAEVRAATPAIFVDIADAAVAAAAVTGARCVGVLAIGATRQARLYHDRLAAAGIATVDAGGDIDGLVGRIKAGDTGGAMQAAMAAEAAVLVAAGARAIIAGCTEVPLVLDQPAVAVPLIDATAALVAATLAAARR